MHFKRLLRFIGLTILSATLPLAYVHAETLSCTPITSLPYTITVPAVYCFTGDLFTSMSSGNAIDIQTNNVTIDLNGHRLGGGSAGTATLAYGIYSLSHTNITVKNGIIRGFYVGVSLQNTAAVNTGGHLLEYLHADANTYVGIEVMGRGNIIRHNQVVDTGGSTNIPDASGIVVQGSGVWVLNNDVVGTMQSGIGSADGIRVAFAPGSIIQNNHISNAPVTANSFGIELDTSTNLTVRDNSISNMDIGINFNGSTGIYMGNVVNGATTPYIGGTAAGLTNF